MKIGIIGLPQTGKKSLFELLTGNKTGPQTDNKSTSGVADIRDTRFDKLVKLFEPKKEVPARIDMELLPKIEQNTIREGEIFRDILDMDAILHVVRAFEDDSVYHIEGSVNAERDIDTINSELTMHDLIFIEKRLERIEKSRRSKADKDLDIEEAIILKLQEHLEKDLHLRTLELTEDEEKILSGYPFITRKKMLIALNIGEDGINDSSLIDSLNEKFKHLDVDIMQVSAKLEAEIASLEDEEEKTEFMQEAGISEPALNALSQLAMRSLGLLSFFTVGTDEVRQWLVRENSTAPVAAGAIHSDIQRGFIRAEVMKYEDLIELGSEEELKKAGKFYVMGKDYVVVDGDIVHFRFNV